MDIEEIKKKVLKKYYGYDEFRPKQSRIINNVLAKKDTLVLMPTGGGKSLCFQIPALMLKGLTIVISPLISLMQDQVHALKANGVKAEYINSSLTPNKIEEIQTRILAGEIKLLYIAPERFAAFGFKDFLKKIKISLIAIDEAHCISEWGHDFRTEYRNLSKLKIMFPNVPLIALTATATLKVKDDILKQLNLETPKIFISGFDRENLNLTIMKKNSTFEKILNILDKYKGESSIIYCFSRKDTESMAKKLKQFGHKALPYHAGLTSKTREKNQDDFIKDKVDIIVATIAFGMGIDKPDVRLVIHHTFSKSVEGYYQEIGRAGRDGLPSECILFYSIGDKKKQEFLINMSKDVENKRAGMQKLSEMINYCEMRGCRKKYLLTYFGEEPKFENGNCGTCDVCLGIEEFIPKKISKSKVNIGNYNSELFDELKQLRTELASEQGVPPYVVFGDKSLQEMATLFPISDEDFINISGVGVQKLKTYGDDFLKVINNFVMVHNITDNMENKNQLISSELSSASYGEMFDTEEGTTYKNYASDYIPSQQIDDTVDRDFNNNKTHKKIRATKKKTRKGIKKAKSSVLVKNQDLYDNLKSLRTRIANSKNSQPYLVFQDSALIEMANKKPKNHTQFLDIKGVGEKKLSEYGADFLREINK
jgi:ATP-dependent DNA helicase RecQ